MESVIAGEDILETVFLVKKVNIARAIDV